MVTGALGYGLLVDHRPHRAPLHPEPHARAGPRPPRARDEPPRPRHAQARGPGVFRRMLAAPRRPPARAWGSARGCCPRRAARRSRSLRTPSSSRSSWRRPPGFAGPLRREKTAAVPAGFVVGALYSATTISGPPIALFLNNQGLAQTQFRAAVYLIRVVESATTTLAYLASALRHPSPRPRRDPHAEPRPRAPRRHPAPPTRRRQTFRRLPMAASATIIAFGLARALREVFALPPPPLRRRLRRTRVRGVPPRQVLLGSQAPEPVGLARRASLPQKDRGAWRPSPT